MNQQPGGAPAAPTPLLPEASVEHIKSSRPYRELLRLFEQAPGFVTFFRGPQHVYELQNHAHHRLAGFRDIIGKPVRVALPELAGQHFFELLDQVFASGEAYVGTALPLEVVPAGGGAATLRYIDFVYQPIVDDAGAVVGIFSQGNDVTERVLAEEALRRKQGELERMIEARTEALADALARHQTELESLVAERTRELGEAQQALSRTQKLESIGKLTGGVAHDFNNILQVVGGNLELLQRRVPDQDANNLVQVARDAMPGGGKLTIEIGNAMLDDSYVAAEPDIKTGQYVMIAVSDTGCGMSRDVLERACEPFFTTKPEGVGTGLGLSMAYGFVKQTGGHFRIYGEPGDGTTIKMYFPRSFEAEAALARPAGGPVVGGSETVLVVEDDPQVQATVVEMLGSLGYRVLKADNASDALSIVKNGLPIDLLFTDVVMPGALRSPELARQAKGLQPNLAVLFTSGYTRNPIVHGGRLDPGVEPLSKPYGRDQLARKVRHLLVNRSVPAPAPAGTKAEGRQVRILVAEDNRDLLDMACRLFDALGQEAHGAATVEDALAVLEAQPVDVLFTDIDLAGQSGVDLARRARAAAARARGVRLRLWRAGWGRGRPRFRGGGEALSAGRPAWYAAPPGANTMIFLNVPYAEKDEARALGARWNPGRKRWYVPDGVAPEAFQKWLSKDGEARSGRSDSAAAKLVLGANFVEMNHACNPFEPCAECQAALAGSRWLEARAAVAGAIAALKR